MTPEQFRKSYLPYLDALMAIVDSDGSGITAEKYARYTRTHLRLKDAVGRDIHGRLDTDGDGLVTKQEYADAVERCVASASWRCMLLQVRPCKPGTPEKCARAVQILLRRVHRVASLLAARRPRQARQRNLLHLKRPSGCRLQKVVVAGPPAACCPPCQRSVRQPTGGLVCCERILSLEL